MNRRTLMVAALAGAAVAPAATAFGAARQRPLAIADITVRRELTADFAGTIATLRGIGYTHFGTRLRRYVPSERQELAAREKKRILDDAGMKVGVVRLAAVRPDGPASDATAAQLDDAALLGASIVAVPTARIFLRPTATSFTRHVPTTAELDGYIAELSALGRQASARKMHLVYHNHDYDAVPIDGVRALDRMIDRTDPRHVGFELDLAWAHIAGYDLLALARRLGPRLRSVHVKDLDRTLATNPMAQMTRPGDGEMEMARLMPKLAALTPALLTVEVDVPKDGIIAARRGYDFVARTLSLRAPAGRAA